jgi:hypothetical protein
MKRLQKLASTSQIMDVYIKYGDEKFKFNLYRELQILDESEGSLNTEIRGQPTTYGFLSMLLTKLKKLQRELDVEKTEVFSEILVNIKSEKDPLTGKPYTKDSAEAKVVMTKEYQEKMKEYNNILHNVETLETCVEAFNQRSYLIQTLSANLRKNE